MIFPTQSYTLRNVPPTDRLLTCVQSSDGGCGFGDAQPNDRAAVALGFTGGVGGGQSSANNAGSGNSSGAGANGAGATSNGRGGGAMNNNPPAGQGNGSGASANAGAGAGAGANNSGAANAGAGAGGNGGGNGASAGNGAQFITGACQSDSDCASGCCGFNSGKCAGPVVAQEVSLDSYFSLAVFFMLTPISEMVAVASAMGSLTTELLRLSELARSEVCSISGNRSALRKRGRHMH